MLDRGESSLNVITRVYLSGLSPSHPIELPDEGGGEVPPTDAHPAHPIYYPDAHPDHTLPGDLPHPAHPIEMPGEEPHPEHPIVIPPDGEIPPGVPPEIGDVLNKFDMKVGWTEDTGWVVVFVPNEGTLVPTPSK